MWADWTLMWGTRCSGTGRPWEDPGTSGTPLLPGADLSSGGAPRAQASRCLCPCERALFRAGALCRAGIWVRESALEGSAALATATPLHGLLRGSVRASPGVFAWFPMGGKHSRERFAFGRRRDLESSLADPSPAVEPILGSSVWPEGFKTSLILVVTDLHLTDIAHPRDRRCPGGPWAGLISKVRCVQASDMGRGGRAPLWLERVGVQRYRRTSERPRAVARRLGTQRPSSPVVWTGHA